MAEKSGFFNALYVDGVYDRKYTADDYCDNLAVVISNGVLRSTADDLKVTGNGMAVTVNEGRGWIKGHWYYNDSPYSFTAVTAPTGGSRYDRVVLRFDNTLQERKVRLAYLQGTAGNTPVKPTLTRNNSVYELCLADIYITANATSVSVTDTRADNTVCGWVYSTSGDASFFTSLDNSFNTWFQSAKDTLSSVTLFKRYNWRTVLSTVATQVSFNIPQYDADTCFLEVYVNGILETLTTDYTVSGSVITFAGTLTAGTEVEVKAYKSIDGTGIMTVSDEITELQNQYATLAGVSKFVYKCTGLNDNISLSQIAQAIYSGSYVAADVTTAANAFLTALGGNTYLAGLASDAQVEIDVVGTLGVTTAYSGTGEATSRYRYFALGIATASEKRLIWDFGKCDRFTINCAGNTSNIIFFGTDMDIRNVKVTARSTAAGCNIEMFTGTTGISDIKVDKSILNVSTSGTPLISKCGDFTDCECYVTSTEANAFCFDCQSQSLIRLFGGKYRAYVSGSFASAPLSIQSAATDAVIMAYNINCPVVTSQYFSQKNLCVANGGRIYINGVVSTLAATGSYATVNGQISKNKP